MFTDRFLKVNCLVYDQTEEDMMGKSYKDNKKIPVEKMINPMRIESFGEAIPIEDFFEDNKIWTNVVMQSGIDFIVTMKMGDFSKLLNDHQK
jgi:hypothetical protein